jgi:hypothetical protein
MLAHVQNAGCPRTGRALAAGRIRTAARLRTTGSEMPPASSGAGHCRCPSPTAVDSQSTSMPPSSRHLASRQNVGLNYPPGWSRIPRCVDDMCPGLRLVLLLRIMVLMKNPPHEHCLPYCDACCASATATLPGRCGVHSRCVPRVPRPGFVAGDVGTGRCQSNTLSPRVWSGPPGALAIHVDEQNINEISGFGHLQPSAVTIGSFDLRGSSQTRRIPASFSRA